MKPKEFAILLLLAAIWGASFLFMRVAAAPFGPVPLILVRVAIAAACLLPLVFLRDGHGEMRTRPREFLVIGLLGSALPFCLLAFASLNLTAAFTALLNAATPLMTALVGMAWYGQRLRAMQWCGLALGMSGVGLLCWGKLSFKEGGSGWAILAALLATVSYGVTAHFSKQRLGSTSPLLTSAGTMTGATLFLLPVGVWQWPAVPPGTADWISVIALGVVCTAVAYLLYFHLITHAGPTHAASVTFLVPVFAMIWSRLFLREAISGRMLVASVVILLGIGLSNGMLGWAMQLNKIRLR